MGNIERQLRRIPKKYQERIFIAMAQITARQFAALDHKQLKGSDHLFRVRVGNYRIIYFDDGKKIIFEAVRKRDEATYSDF